MSYAPNKLVPEGFTSVPSLAALPSIAGADTVPDDVDAIAYLVTSDGELPSDVELTREDLAMAGFEAERWREYRARASGRAPSARGHRRSR